MINATSVAKKYIVNQNQPVRALVMTGPAISEFSTQFRIILGVLLMAVQAEAHVEGLWILCNIHFTHIPVTILAVDSRRNMRTMVEMHKIRHDHHRNPFERLMIRYSLYQGFQLFAGLGDRQLLVTTPAFGLGR